MNIPTTWAKVMIRPAALQAATEATEEFDTETWLAEKPHVELSHNGGVLYLYNPVAGYTWRFLKGEWHLRSEVPPL